MDKKTVLRIYAKDIRKSLDISQLSIEAVKKIKKFEPYKNAKNVMLFYPTMDEIDLRELLKDDKKFYLPKVDGKTLLVCPYCVGDKLEKSCFNINEPCAAPVDAENLDLIIVPALAVDKNNYRLGYGGGFYDRFLALYPEISTITAISQKLVIFEIPAEKHDIKIDYLIKI